MNLVRQKPTLLNLVGHIQYTSQDIYKSQDTLNSMYSHSGTTLSKVLECLVNFIAKCLLSEFAIGFCHSKKMYNVKNNIVKNNVTNQFYSYFIVLTLFQFQLMRWSCSINS